MTKIERAKELIVIAKHRAAEARALQAQWSETGTTSVARLHGENAELFELEAEMYGDLLSMYEKGDSTVETKCPGDGTEGES